METPVDPTGPNQAAWLLKVSPNLKVSSLESRESHAGGGGAGGGGGGLVGSCAGVKGEKVKWRVQNIMGVFRNARDSG